MRRGDLISCGSPDFKNRFAVRLPDRSLVNITSGLCELQHYATYMMNEPLNEVFVFVGDINDFCVTAPEMDVLNSLTRWCLSLTESQFGDDNQYSIVSPLRHPGLMLVVLTDVIEKFFVPLGEIER